MTESERDSIARHFQFMCAIETAKMQMAISRMRIEEILNKYIGKPIHDEALQTT